MKKENTEKKIQAQMFKKSGDELQMYFHFKKRGFTKANKKGKGSFKRRKKYRQDYSQE
jgi:hypothetical protein